MFDEPTEPYSHAYALYSARGSSVERRGSWGIFAHWRVNMRTSMYHCTSGTPPKLQALACVIQSRGRPFPTD